MNKDSFNQVYESNTAAWGYEPAECLKKWIKEFPENATVLDLGCGSGRNANYLSENGFKVLESTSICPIFIPPLNKGTTISAFT